MIWRVFSIGLLVAIVLSLFIEWLFPIKNYTIQELCSKDLLKRDTCMVLNNG